MILGKTYLERQTWLKKFIEDIDSGELNGWRKFAFLPTRLDDGRYVWLQCYYVFWKTYTFHAMKSIVVDNYHKPIEYKFLTREEGLDALHKAKR